MIRILQGIVVGLLICVFQICAAQNECLAEISLYIQNILGTQTFSIANGYVYHPAKNGQPGYYTLGDNRYTAKFKIDSPCAKDFGETSVIYQCAKGNSCQPIERFDYYLQRKQPVYPTVHTYKCHIDAGSLDTLCDIVSEHDWSFASPLRLTLE